MTEQIRENYFGVARIMMILALEIYIAIMQSDLAGTSGRMLLLLALFLGSVAGREALPRSSQWIAVLAAGGVMGVMIAQYGPAYSMLGMVLAYESISCFSLRNSGWYLAPLLLACIPTDIHIGIRLLVCLFLGLIYFQQNMVIAVYRSRMREDICREQSLKENIHQKEIAWREELRRSVLAAENQMLEEKESLSQTLHDRLGHNMNGSIYQLEAVKILMEQDIESSRGMIQAVIESLRTGMDEIRAILRRERPRKHKLALMQLKQLCEECCRMGVEASLLTEGEIENIPEKYLEIVMDNAFEAVSNALKYAKCTRIEIKIYVMNKMLRCSVTDNGIGCGEIIDGMGISGMRKRMRSANGILDFNTDMGFSVNMLLPLEK